MANPTRFDHEGHEMAQFTAETYRRICELSKTDSKESEKGDFPPKQAQNGPEANQK